MPLRIKFKGKDELKVIDAGHDTKLSEDGRDLLIVDRAGKEIEGEKVPVGDVSVVERF